jgi:hypothetical protein
MTKGLKFLFTGIFVTILALFMWRTTHNIWAWLVFFIPGGYYTFNGIWLVYFENRQ